MAFNVQRPSAMLLTPQLSFPQELLELFLDAIPLDSEEGRKSLCSCLLVSKIFFLRSRSRLFAHISFNPFKIENTANLRSLLEFDGPKGGVIDYPRLDVHIKSVRIMWPFEAFMPSNSEDATHMGGMKNGDDISAILCLLAKSQVLQALELYFIRTTKFSEFHAAVDIYHPIRKILDLPSFETLKLECLSRVPAGFINIWQLKELRLIDVTFSPDDHDSGIPRSLAMQANSTAQLRTFTYLFRPPLPEIWFQHPTPFSGIKTLTVKIDYRHLDSPSPAFSELLIQSHTTIHTLDIHLALSKPVSQVYPHTLQDLTGLRELKFRVSANLDSSSGYRRCYFDRTNDVVESLKTFKSAPSNLKRIAIFFFSWIDDNRVIEFRSERDWQSLGDLLMERFDAVEKIEVGLLVVLNVAPGSQKEREEEPFLKSFPRVWQERYPNITITATQSAEFRDDLLC